MIGIFDSGSGGLTILAACLRYLPQETFIYLGDHGRAPYGNRPNSEIVNMTTEMVAALFDQGCRLVVMACNTAAAVALRTIQQDWLEDHYPGRRVLGVLVPTVEELTGKPWIDPVAHAPGATPARTIGVFATRKTVESRSYVEEVKKRDPNAHVVQQACPHLVGLIEAGADRHVIDDTVSEAVASLAAQTPLDALDAVLLGCTHYPLIEDIFRRHLPRKTEIISQPVIVAAALRDYLDRHPDMKTRPEARAPHVRYFTTGDPHQTDIVAARLTDLDVQFERLKA